MTQHWESHDAKAVVDEKFLWLLALLNELQLQKISDQCASSQIAHSVSHLPVLFKLHIRSNSSWHHQRFVSLDMQSITCLPVFESVESLVQVNGLFLQRRAIAAATISSLLGTMVYASTRDEATLRYMIIIVESYLIFFL